MENSMKNNDEIEIDLRQIFIVIMSKIAIILLVGGFSAWRHLLEVNCF